MSDDTARTRNVLIEELERVDPRFVVVTVPLLAELMRAAHLAGSFPRGSTPHPSSYSSEDLARARDKKAQAYARHQLLRGELPVHDLAFLPIRDADQDALLIRESKGGARP